MEININDLASEFRELKQAMPPKVPQLFNEQEECEYLAELVAGELAAPLAAYESPHASGAGGSGLVINARYMPVGNVRAIKVPRKTTPVVAATEESPFVDPELHALIKLSHQNITRLYDSFPLARGGTCMVTEFVENPRSLDEYAELLCCSEVCRINEHLFLAATEKLADLVYQVADALMYMHGSAHLIHFDIKPDNILVSANGQPFITDLGFARDQTKYSAGETVEVGFTFRYAHPLVTDPDRGARISKDPRRSRNTIKAEDIRPVIDLFAFGRTIQEVIKKLELVHGDSIYSNYVFRALPIE